MLWVSSAFFFDAGLLVWELRNSVFIFSENKMTAPAMGKIILTDIFKDKIQTSVSYNMTRTGSTRS